MDPGGRNKVLLDLLGFAVAQEAMVDKDTGQLVANRLVDERRGDGGVDAAGEGTQHPFVADGRADRGDLVLDDTPGRPVRGDSCPLEEEVLEHLLTERGVNDLGVPLHAIQPATLVLECRDR